MCAATRLLVCLALAASAAPAARAAPALGAGPGPRFTLTVDSARRQVILTLGPYRLARDAGMDGMMDMPELDDHSPRFEWPRDTWLNRYEIHVTAADGSALPSRLLHHYALVDFDRRELAYPIVLRVFGGGEETGDVSLPNTVAVPLSGGDHVGFYFMWHNDSGRDLDGVMLRVVMSWIPRSQQPPPALVLPFWVDVAYAPDAPNEFDDPPGGCTRSWEFTLPASVRLIAASGHLHAWGSAMRLEDAATGKVLMRVTADRDASGEVRGVSRDLAGLWGRGLHLRANHRYRVVAVYDNPTGRDNPRVMGLFGGLVVPDDIRRWPRIDPGDPTYRADLARFDAADAKVPGAVAGRE